MRVNLLILLLLISSGFNYAQDGNFLALMRKSPNHPSVQDFIVKMQFNLAGTDPARGTNTFEATEENVSKLLSSEKYIDFKKKTSNSSNPYGIGFTVEIKKGMVRYIICEDTLFLKENAAKMSLNYDYEELQKNYPQHLYYSSSDKKEACYMYDDSVGVALKYNPKTGKMNQLIAYSPGSFFFNDIKNKTLYKSYTKTEPAATQANSNKSSDTDWKCVSGNCVNGYGKKSEAKSNITYEGQFSGGYFQGLGKLTFPDGSTYYGEFVKDNINGHGRAEYSNGNSYVGYWKNWVFHGEGTYFVNGKWNYKGNFTNGEPTCNTCYNVEVPIPVDNGGTPLYTNRNQWLLESISRQQTERDNLNKYQDSESWFEQYQKRNY